MTVLIVLQFGKISEIWMFATHFTGHFKEIDKAVFYLD